jgi:hypothetical protein
MPFENQLAQFNTIISEYKYNIRLNSNNERVYDSQALNQIGTDKDYITLNPDISPNVGTGLTDSNTIFISWSGNNANAGTSAAPKRSFLDGGYNSAGTGALNAAISAGYNISFVTGSTNQWVEGVIIPQEITLYKYQSVDTPTLRTVKRTLPNSGNLTDATARFVDPNVVGPGSGTQASPYKALQDAIDNMGGRVYIVIFNSGASGSPGDNVSLVLTEVIDLTGANIEIHTGIQWATNWFSAGDMAFLYYDSSIPLQDTTTTCSKFRNSLVSASLNAKYRYYSLCNDPVSYRGYLEYTEDGSTFTQAQISSDANFLAFDIEQYLGYVVVASLRSSGGFTTNWANNLSSPPVVGDWTERGSSSNTYSCYRLRTKGAYLYTLERTSTTMAIGKFNSSFAYTKLDEINYSISSDTVTQLVLHDDGAIYFGVTANSDIFYISIDEKLLQLENVPPIDRVCSMFSFNGYLYVLGYSFSGSSVEFDNFIYRFDGTVWSLMYSDLDTGYRFSEQESPLINDNKIYINYRGGSPTNSYLLLYDGNFTVSNLNITEATASFLFYSRSMAQYNGWIMIPAQTKKSTGAIRKFFPNQLLNRGTGQKICGIEFAGNNFAANGISSVRINPVSSGSGYISLLQYCQFNYQHYSNIGAFLYFGPTSTQEQGYNYEEILNNIFKNSEYGIHRLDSVSATENVKYNLFRNLTLALENFSIGSGQNIQYNTFDNDAQAIQWACVADRDIEYCLFSRVGTVIDNVSSISTPTLKNSIIPSNAQYIAAIIDSTVYSGEIAYRDRNNGDYRLQAIGDEASNGVQYIINSLGVGIGSFTTGRLGSDIHGDNYTFFSDGDAGCYQIARALYSQDYETKWLLRPYPNEMTIAYVPKVTTVFDSREGNTYQNFVKFKKRFLMNWDNFNAWSFEDIETLRYLLEQSSEVLIEFNTPLESDYTFANQAAWLASQLRTDIIDHKVGLYSGQDSALFTKSSLTLSTNCTFIPNQFKGFYLTMLDKADQDTSSTFHPRRSDFYVLSNDTNTFTLENLNNENLGKYGATVDVATNDLVWIVSNIYTQYNVENALEFVASVLAGLNLYDQFPQTITTQLIFEELKAL